MENINEILRQFNAHINKCRKYGNPRIEMCYHVLLIEIKKVFEWAGLNAKYLYGKNCEEYGAVMDFEVD